MKRFLIVFFCLFFIGCATTKDDNVFQMSEAPWVWKKERPDHPSIIEVYSSIPPTPTHLCKVAIWADGNVSAFIAYRDTDGRNVIYGVWTTRMPRLAGRAPNGAYMIEAPWEERKTVDGVPVESSGADEIIADECGMPGGKYLPPIVLEKFLGVFGFTPRTLERSERK